MSILGYSEGRSLPPLPQGQARPEAEESLVWVKKKDKKVLLLPQHQGRCAVSPALPCPALPTGDPQAALPQRGRTGGIPRARGRAAVCVSVPIPVSPCGCLGGGPGSGL